MNRPRGPSVTGSIQSLGEINMRTIFAAAILITVALIVAAFAPEVGAEPKSGYGLFVESAQLVSQDSNTGEEYAKATLGGGFSYQLALGDAFSLGIVLSRAGGKASFPTLPDVSVHDVSSLELEARFWLDSVFVGLHGGVFSLATAEGFSSPSPSNGAMGGGFSLGYEDDSGWFLVAQSVSVSGVQVSDGPLVDISGYRLRLGYRWR